MALIVFFRNRKRSKSMLPSSHHIVFLPNGREKTVHVASSLCELFSPTSGHCLLMFLQTFPMHNWQSWHSTATSSGPQSSLFYRVDVSVLIFTPVRADQSGVYSGIIWYSPPDVVKHCGVISILRMELNARIILWANTSALRYYSTLKDTATG